MNPINHIKGWIRQWRRKRAFKRYKAELREFVYLDEVSVYSLIASRLGPIAAEFTDTETTSLQGELSGGFGASSGLAKGELSSRVIETQTSGSQVLRKSIVQTTFKEFYENELEKNSLVMRPVANGLKPPIIQELNELSDIIPKLANDSAGWVFDPTKLVRGQLLELEVQLEAEEIFRMRAVVSALSEILDENPGLPFGGSHDDLVQMKSVVRILDKLLVGLVPIRGQVIDYKVLEIDGKQWIIHNKIVDQITIEDSASIHGLFVVGVAEQSLFWKDIRRILFSKGQFRILSRITINGVQDSWNPVKLVHVLETIAPELANQINTTSLSMFDTMAKYATTKQITSKTERWNDALVRYATLLANHYDRSITADVLSENNLPAEQHRLSLDSVIKRRNAFNEIADFVINKFELKHEPDVVAKYRDIALTDAGLDAWGRSLQVDKSVSLHSALSSDNRYIDSEFVAIYW